MSAEPQRRPSEAGDTRSVASAAGDDAAHPHAQTPQLPTGELARQLTGDLPCITCRYNLRGLSVKAVCPECGTPVRAAILAAVDPYAAVLQPVYAPRLTALLLLLWAGGALAAAILTWGVRGCDLVVAMLERPCPSRSLAVAAFWCIIASGAGALALVRPHARIPLWGSIAAAIGIIATFAFAAVYWRLHLFFDPVHTRPYFHLDGALADRSLLRLAGGALLLVVILCLRPNARLLAARSLLLRLGYVDRQAMLAMAVAVAVAAIGDLLHLLAARTGVLGQTMASIGLFMIAVGSMLFTVGLFGVLRDALRIGSVLIRPPLAPSQVVGPEPGPAAPAPGAGARP